MKRIFLAAGILMVAATTFAQNELVHETRRETRVENREARKDSRAERRQDNRGEVSLLAKDQFAVDFPDAKNARFVRADNFDEVYFMSGDDNLKAYYDNDSKLVGTTQRKEFADLPEKAQRQIQKEYAGYNPAAVIKFDDNEDNSMDMILYGTSFEDADNYFIELVKDNQKIVVKANMEGEVSYFKAIK
jgi:hypothetical protein